MGVSSRVLKKEIFRGVFRTLSDAYDEIFLAEVVKGYLHYKTIFCHKAALDAQLMNIFI